MFDVVLIIIALVGILLLFAFVFGSMFKFPSLGDIKLDVSGVIPKEWPSVFKPAGQAYATVMGLPPIGEHPQEVESVLESIERAQHRDEPYMGWVTPSEYFEEYPLPKVIEPISGETKTLPPPTQQFAGLRYLYEQAQK